MRIQRILNSSGGAVSKKIYDHKKSEDAATKAAHHGMSQGKCFAFARCYAFAAECEWNCGTFATRYEASAYQFQQWHLRQYQCAFLPAMPVMPIWARPDLSPANDQGDLPGG
ncbi:hypothetical protein PCAR4_840089 [Paraburkholderia caribensis]|nr:hypothetical protein PCAR4_840089 [Paraburkholderia caribensis]